MKNMNKILVLLLILITFAAASSQTTLLRRNNFAENTKQRFNLQFHKDTLLYNSYGDLLNDDPKYNKKSTWWKPALGVVRSIC